MSVRKKPENLFALITVQRESSKGGKEYGWSICRINTAKPFWGHFYKRREDAERQRIQFERSYPKWLKHEIQSFGLGPQPYRRSKGWRKEYGPED